MCVVGVAVGIWLSPLIRHEADREIVYRDTTIVVTEKNYGRFELESAKIKLDLSGYDIDVPSVVFVPEEKVRVEIRDSIKYVVLPREYYYTEKGGVNIWHSGIDSSIDSLKVTEREYLVETVYQERKKKNTFGVGIEGSYSLAFRLPIQVEYSRKVLPWLSAYAYGEYELITRQYGAGVGTRLEFSW